MPFNSQEVFSRFAFDDIKEAVLFLIISDSLVSSQVFTKPKRHLGDWTLSWHPFMGTCITFTPIKPLAESLKGSDAKVMNFYFDFDAAFPAEKSLFILNLDF